MLRIAICDDEQIMREEIMRTLDEYSRMRNLDIIYDQYASGIAFFKQGRTHLYNIVILDFQLHKDEKIDGLMVARKLRHNNQDAAIIFLTSHPKIVFSSFEVDTFRFLVKPLNPAKLFNALDAFLKTLDTDMTLIVRHSGETNVLNTKEILFVEGNGKYCTIHMLSPLKDIECFETLANVEKRLPKHLFFRCHRSFVINYKHVHSYDRDTITLRNGGKIYISRNKYKGFEDAFIEYTKRYGY